MRVQVLSDLHFEFHRDGGEEFVRLLDPTDVDVLVVAGDLGTRPFLAEALSRLCDRYADLVYVVGNHEYYGSHHDDVHEELARVDARLPNLHWLHHEVTTIGGVVFAGAPLWFSPSHEAALNKGSMMDFHVIKGFEPWVYDENAKGLAFLEQAKDSADVVVTHHLPSQRSVAPQFVGSSINCYFVCDVERFTGSRPKLWVHGHTHCSCDYALGATRVVCHPFGYPDALNADYVEKLVVEVDPDGGATG